MDCHASEIERRHKVNRDRVDENIVIGNIEKYATLIDLISSKSSQWNCSISIEEVWSKLSKVNTTIP